VSTEIECAVLALPCQADWVEPWMNRRGLNMRRQRFVRLTVACDESGRPSAWNALDALRADLYRYQVCILPVDAATLSWLRTGLGNLNPPLPVPLLCLCHALRAEAIDDLLRLGADDFVDTASGVDEVRARCTRVIRQTHRTAAAEPGYIADPPASAGAIVHLEKGMAARCGESARRYDAVPLVWPGEDDSFSRAKKRVIDRFECDYLRSALMRSAGNVASAARASAKHRRAFWALMRKHGIHADQFRQSRRVRR